MLKGITFGEEEERVAFIGSFDPPTKGHIRLLTEALDRLHADHITVVAAANPAKRKNRLLDLDVTARLFQLSLPENLRERVTVTTAASRVQAFREARATVLIQGSRDWHDRVYQFRTKWRRRLVSPFLGIPWSKEYLIKDGSSSDPVSSTIVRRALRGQGPASDIDRCLEAPVAKILREAMKTASPSRDPRLFNQAVRENLSASLPGSDFSRQP